MVKVSPWYSSKTKKVYHYNTNCPEGNNIEPKYRKQGTGGLQKCNHCKRLN